MTREEVAAFLAEQRRIILVSNGPHGLPHPVPMNYGLDEQGRIVITSYARSQKVLNLERDPRATLLVETGARYHDLKAVILFCEAEILKEPEVVRSVMRGIRADTALTEGMTEQMGEQIRSSVGKRVVIRLTPFRTISWDHAKLGARY
jgi:nitroimidazol reductase NimA-like FMN-containing flavoprotein (pyridoxamine 5'-phosphate oxidase superfamily)